MTDDTDRTERGLGSFNDWLDRVIVELEAAGQALPGGQGDHYRDLADAGRRHRSRLRSPGDRGGDENPIPVCHAPQDGECDWRWCPQERDGEPARSGRHCPLDMIDRRLRAASTDAPSLAGCPVCDAGEIHEDHDGEFYCTDCSFRGRVCHTNRNRTPTSRSYVSYDDELRVEHGQLARSTDAPEERSHLVYCQFCGMAYPLGYEHGCGGDEGVYVRKPADAAPVRGEERDIENYVGALGVVQKNLEVALEYWDEDYAPRYQVNNARQIVTRIREKLEGRAEPVVAARPTPEDASEEQT